MLRHDVLKETKEESIIEFNGRIYRPEKYFGEFQGGSSRSDESDLGWSSPPPPPLGIRLRRGGVKDGSSFRTTTKDRQVTNSGKVDN